MRLAFRRFGDAKAKAVLVFVHGHTSSKESWNPIVSRLEGFNCIAFDLRGHGESALSPFGEDDYSPAALARDLHEMVQSEVNSEGDKDIYLVGHSMGGRVVVP